MDEGLTVRGALEMNEEILRARFLAEVLVNPHNKFIFDRWDALALKDGWLVAGCLFQTVWNLKSGAPPDAQIRDYDLFYFDAGDLSEEAERGVQQRVSAVLEDIGVTVEAKNQARVHLWYEDYFGFPCAPLRSSCDGIDRFLIPATCVGMRPVGNDWGLYAPHGLALLYEGILGPNPLTNHRSLFQKKARSYQERWPWLQMVGAEFQ